MLNAPASILERLLPKPVDNRVRGHVLALWLFVPITLVSLVRSCIHIVKADGGAQTIATIPLEAFTDDGAASVIALFAQWGLSQLVIALLFVVVLLRYRALLSLMYVLLLVEYIGRLAIGSMKPIVTVGTPPGGPGSFAVIALAALGLFLSLRWGPSPAEDLRSRD
jgi:hypothetical protein